MNPSTAAARALVAELVRRGVRHSVLAPGSRSAPLAHALADAAGRGELRLHVRIDERVAAFTALGLARGSGPVAVVTTSGTAVASLHPAVLEAAHGGVPLLLLTADRPHEVRGTGANQTTDQVRIFGTAVRFFADVPAPFGRPGEAADLRNLVARALAAADGVRSGDPGPAHLNLAFREPLVPDLDSGADSGSESPVEVTGAVRVDPLAAVEPVLLDDGPRTVVVAGDRAGAAAREFAEAAGHPMLAEPSSGARAGACAIGPYRLLVPRPDLGGRIERAVVFGHPTLSRPVSALLARSDVEIVVVAGRGPEWPDAGRRAARVVSSVHAGGPSRHGDWLSAWQQAGKAAQQAVDDVAAAGPLTGPAVAAAVWAARQPGEYLMTGSSNPVRDLDLAAAPSPAGADDGSVLANRGLAGIDGTLSTATGVALATGRPTRALVGDLTFLHDAGGLLLGPLEEQPDLQVVVVNDDGGGIFALLEHGEPAHAARFERVFGTPHGADLAALCAGYGVPHRRASDLDSLRAALASPPAGRSVVEVPVDRAALRDLHARIRAAVDAALS
ncbi:2-succinyl-5-enolpyruvyl-6-hydroxy-3-cyclohexene-1-carboxylic-acid synthase [Jiangella gansuensis]|uniref:2-succinyl-5-enolpyruvyl-6-hydroxy-3- cyclohexene-1-carboxylic-acid synthase n=1 Tax=Jiangella gansuensis TaxID=281473 RepID=UPI00047AF5C4|nr:2-succinyl-5-enolpyruvyl-6-hydroxy-3-cyclohexene-1-carboxylic-acid synthase [Jiangella gansuensis]